MKKSLEEANEYVVAWASIFFALPFLIPVVLYQGIPRLDEQFWFALAWSASLNFVAIILYAKAIKVSDLSLTVPLIAFSPLFLLLTAPIIVGEFPSLSGVVGVLLVVVGSYLLNLRERQKGYLAPYRALLHEQGPRLMLGVAFIWSIAAAIDKVGLQHSAPIFWGTAVNSVILIPMTIMMLRRAGSMAHIQRNFLQLVAIGLLAALVSMCQMTAAALTLVAYVIAVKRTSTVMSVLFGHVLLREEGVRERLAGAVVMVCGILCITLL